MEFFLLFIMANGVVYAQQDSLLFLCGRGIADGDYMYSIRLLRSLEDQYVHSKWADLYLQILSYQMTCVGDEREAMKLHNIFRKRMNWRPPNVEFPSRYQLIRADSIILERARDHKFVIINEAHHMPQHRFFTYRILQSLQSVGFTYLAIESSKQELAANPPRRTASGWYYNGPTYGHLIREAHRLGMKVIPYDTSTGNVDMRERAQARRLQKIILDDPKAKIIVHCGYGHLYEKSTRNKMMAEYLKDWTRLDPLTIDQTFFTLSGDPEMDIKGLGQIQESKSIQDVSILLSDGQVWTPWEEVDLYLLHPEAIYRNNRPHWRRQATGSRSLTIDAHWLKGEGPFLVQAFRSDDPHDAIPIDQIVVSDAHMPTDLILYDESFIIHVWDSTGKIVNTIQTNPTK
jgi:hypothetical protein